MSESAKFSGNAALLELTQQGDMAAQEKIIRKNLGLVRSIVRKFLFRNVEEEDLFQIGCLGLLKAARRFDPSYNVQFSTYAVPVIMGEIKRFLRDDGAVKVSRELKELSIRARREKEALVSLLGREPTFSELSERLETDEDTLLLALDAAQPVESLSEPLSGDDQDFTLESVLSQKDDAEELVDKIALREVIQRLPEKERNLIILRYFKGKTQTQAAQLLSMSQVQVSRLEKKILLSLKKVMEKERA